jgi:hypothetical protein
MFSHGEMPFIDLSSDTEDIVFPIEYLVAIPTLSNYTNTAPGKNETLQRSAILVE